jgi:hypothetical protein
MKHSLWHHFSGGGEPELVNGHPGLRVGIERVRGDRSRFAQRIEIVDQRQAAMVIAEL